MRTTKSKALATLALAAAVVTALAGCAGTGGGQKSGTPGGGGLKTVNVGIVQLSIFAPIYVAEAKGYFKDEGITVNLQNVKSGQDAIPLASSGKLDVVAAGFSAGMFNAVAAGLDIKVVSSMGVAGAADEEPASALVVSKKEYDAGTLKTVADLKGKKIGVSGGSGATGAYYVSLALEEAGLTAKDVTWVNLSNPDIPTALKTGGIDAGFTSAPFWNNTVTDGTGQKIWQTPKGVSGTGMIYGGQFANSALAQPFFDAVARGAQDLQGDAKESDANIKIVADATGQTPEEVKSTPLYDFLPNLAPLPDQLAGMQKLWMSMGALNYDKALEPSEFVTTKFADAVKVG